MSLGNRICVVVLALLWSGFALAEQNEVQDKRESGFENLKKGLTGYLSCDGRLGITSATSGETHVEFDRDSEAWTFDLKKAVSREPRFARGKFGQSLFVEYGRCSCDLNAGQNLLEHTRFAPLNNSNVLNVEMVDDAPCVKVSGEAPACSVEIPKLSVEAKQFCFSVYLRSETAKNVKVRIGEAEKCFEIDNEWKRVELLVEADIIHRVTRVDISMGESGAFDAAAPMLEKVSDHYTKKTTASTWLPPYRKRPGDRLRLPIPKNPDEGTVAFWVRLIGKNSWRRLLSFDGSRGWSPLWALDVKNDQACVIGKKSVKSTCALSDGNWHHILLRWKDGQSELFVDGVKLLTVEIPALDKPLYVGCTPDSSSPGLRADALFDEMTLWERSLGNAEIERLVALQKPFSDVLEKTVRLRDLEPVSAFCRDDFERKWNFDITNEGDVELVDLKVVWGIEGVFQNELCIAKVAGRSSVPLSIIWEPAKLMTGKYRFFIEVGDARHERDIEICPARVPRENVQLVSWGGNSREYRDLGLTMAGVTGVEPVQVEKANRNGLYSQARVNIYSEATNPDDMMLDIAGKPTRVDQRASGPLSILTERAEALGRRLSTLPDVREMILNTENLWTWGLDFRPRTIEFAKREFGLDLTPWTKVPAKKRWQAIHPQGRLSPKIGGIPLPADRFVSESDPLYSFMRWWHGGQSGTEVFLNDFVAEKARRQAPWVKSIVEPVLRRPALRVFNSQDILQEWFYYENPLVAISVQEKLTAAARGTGAKIAGMPQFLFKPGVAAPYKAMPAPHLFRESMWLCLARPLIQFCFWGIQMALEPGKSGLTQDKIEKELIKRLAGKPLNYENVNKAISRRGEHTDLSLFIPELRAEIDHMLNNVVRPLGALAPKWENRPRKIALYISFAGQLYGEERWGKPLPLMEALPYPFDVIYDQDFEDNPDLLSRYRVVIVRESSAMIAQAASQLKRFGENGGLILANETFRSAFENVVIMKGGITDRNAMERMNDKRIELLKLYKKADHPQFIEGMEQLSQELKTEMSTTEKTLELIEKNASPVITTDCSEVRLNFLQASGVDYIVVVNDKRTTGEYFGAYGRIREKGVPLRNVGFDMRHPLGKVAYELLTCREVDIAISNFKLDFPPAGGKIVIFLPEKIETLSVSGTKNVGKGEFATARVDLKGHSGKYVPGLIPVKLDITRPDGVVDDLSRYDVIKNGILNYRFPIPLNAPEGIWRVSILELASGKKSECEIKVR